MRRSTFLLSLLAGLISGCNFFGMTTTGVGAKVAPSKAMENRGSPHKSKLVVGFLERLPNDTDVNAWVTVHALDNNLVASASVGRQGYYAVFVPPGSYRVSVYLDRDGDGVIYPHELAGQSPDPFTVPPGPRVAFFGLDLQLDVSARAGLGGLMQVLDREVKLDEGIPEMTAAEELYAPRFGQQNVDLGTYQSTVAFFNHVSPIQFLDEVDLTTSRVPMVLVHGISDSPQIFYEFERHIPRGHFEPLYYFYPTGARLPAMAQLLYHLFFSGEVFPTFSRSALIAHSMGGLVARSCLNEFSQRPGEGKVDFYGSFVSPYGGVSLAESGITSGPVIVPSWIDMSPERDFLTHLFKPLPPHLVFAMAQGNANGRSDGTIALSSQARPEAVAQAKYVEVFPSTHVGIMSNAQAIEIMLGWARQSMPPHPLQPAAEATAPLDNLELRHRAYALRVALRDRIATRGLRGFVSLITPTVARLRLANAHTSLVLHLSVGQGVRLDEVGSDQSLIFEAWPAEKGALDALAERAVRLIAARLQEKTAGPLRPRVPGALRFQAQSQAQLRQAKNAPDELTHWTPPPIALGSGMAVTINPKSGAVQVDVPFKLDAYFGYFGLGLDAHYTVWGALIKTSYANILFEPVTVAAGPRVRFGHRAAQWTGQVGVSGGFELGVASFLAPGAGRISNGDDELDRKFLAVPKVYGSFGVGYRILQDFYGVALVDLGAQFPPKKIQLPDDVTLHVPTTGFVRAALGVEVRLP